MGSIPNRFMKMDWLKWGNSHFCEHGHTYLEHFGCFKEEQQQARIGYFDIESSQLVADFGFCIAWKILSEDGTMYGRSITKKEVLGPTLDKNLMKELVKTFENFDIIYTYFGTKFDFPFVRSRCIINNLDFPAYGGLKHKDTYYIIRNKFKLHRSRLDVACEMLLGRTLKTHWLGNHWIAAVQGVKSSLDYIEDHCEKDVIDLKLLTEKVLEFSQPLYRSI
jgi:uncharacterized protein YprB with RNaseH-like and TPR domain